MAWQGFFKPLNPEKYIGNVKNICYRSSLEFKYMRWLDLNDDVIMWGSEEIALPYYSPVDKKIHRYFPDMLVKFKDLTIILVEIKPSQQCVPPNQKTNKRRLLRETITYAINDAKWKAASKFCEEKGWKFVVITEKDIKNLH